MPTWEALMPADLHLISRILDWIKPRLAGSHELATLSRADLDFLASDIGLTEADLRHLVPKQGDHSELMDQMMLARGLNPDVVRRLAGTLNRDMDIACARCDAVAGCRMALRTGTAAQGAGAFCPNHAIMSDLLGEEA